MINRQTKSTDVNMPIPRTTWCVTGTEGAIHEWQQSSRIVGDFGGVEFHHRNEPEYSEGYSTYKSCWAVDGDRCWHDGSGLLFDDYIRPILEDDAAIFSYLTKLYNETWSQS